MFETCRDCDVVQSPTGSRKVSLRSMSRGFNGIVCIDHFSPDNKDVLHMMDSQTRYSLGSLTKSTSMSDAILMLDSLWLSEFWPPDFVQGDKAFDNSGFKDYLAVYDVRFRPVPPRRHSKNVLESTHRIIRDIYLRLKSASTSEDPRLLVSKMFRISNDLYGNNIASAHELAKGYTRPVTLDMPLLLPPELRNAQAELSAKRKLNLILSSNSITEPPIRVGDLVQVYIKLQNQKRGSWRTLQPVLTYDSDSRTVTVPGSHGCKRQAAVEDVRHAVSASELASEIQVAIDSLNREIEDTFDSISDSGEVCDERQATANRRVSFTDTEEFISDELPTSTSCLLADDDIERNAGDELDALMYVPPLSSTFGTEASSGDNPVTPTAEPQHESTQSSGDALQTTRSIHPMQLRSQH